MLISRRESVVKSRGFYILVTPGTKAPLPLGIQKYGIMKDSIIIVSGGMDSITMLYEYKDQIAEGVSFDYGSNHNAREIPFAKLHCERLGIRHLTIPLGFMHDYFKSSLLEGAEAIPEGHYTDVMIANHAGDHTIYPDCRPAFIDAMSGAMRAGTFEDIRIFAPYTNITKGEIARHGKALGINYAETWSCYKGGEKHCGRCGTCVERKEALAYAGIDDPTEYEE